MKKTDPSRTVKFVVTFQDGISDELLKLYTTHSKEFLKHTSLEQLTDYAESETEAEAFAELQAPLVSIVKG